jgi:hypothetical protein
MRNMSDLPEYLADIESATTVFKIVEGKRVIEWLTEYGLQTRRLILEGDGFAGSVKGTYTSRLDTHPDISVTIESNNPLEFANAISALISM